VGVFKGHKAAALTAKAGLAPPPKKPPECPKDARATVVKKLDKLLELPEMEKPRWAPHLADGPVPDVHYVKNWLQPNEAKELQRKILETCDWDHMRTRDTQEFGSLDRCPCGLSLMRETLPMWQSSFVTALHNLGVFHPVLFPANSVRINAYKPGQGIFPHMDGPMYYPRAAIISLGTSCIFDFYPREDDAEEKRSFNWDQDQEVPSGPKMPRDTKPATSLFVEPGSLLIFSGDAFIYHRHGIRDVEADEITPEVRNAKDVKLSVGDSVNRDGRRVSLTIRHLLARCECQAGF
jgi:alkylated DNA repair protein alkB family protein 6